MPGTKYSFIPPSKKFVLNDDGPGLKDPKTGIFITLKELPLAYEEVTAILDPEALKSKYIVRVKEEIDFNGSKAIIFTDELHAVGTLAYWKYLVFGNDKKTVVVTARYLGSAKGHEAAIKQSLLSTLYNP